MLLLYRRYNKRSDKFRTRKKCNWRVYKLLGVGSVGAVFTAESLIEHCQVVR